MEKILYFLLFALAVGLFVLYRSFSRSIRGVWVQEEEDGWLEILLEQRGPTVSGRCYVEGGHYEFSGLWTGRSVRLKRRDFGQQMLTGKGFPETIARKIEGTVMGRLNLTLKDPDTLSGFFYPQYIKWNKAKTRVEVRHFLDPRWRTWLRRDSEAARALIAEKEAQSEAREASEGPEGPQSG